MGHTARSIFGRALTTYRARFRVLGPMALLVFSIGGVADAAAQLVADSVAHGHTGGWGTLLRAGALLTGAVSSAGIVFYATDHKVRHGHGVWHLFVLGGSGCHFFTVLHFVA